jgi:serine protease Do/serine protease DegQ
MTQKILSLIALTAVALGSAAQAQIPPKVGGVEVPSLAPIIKKVSPAVVSIATKRTVQETRNPLFDDPNFRRFFGVPEEPQQRELQAVGSGVIVDAKQGYIVTNAHVVEDANEIMVTLHDDREVKAQIVGKDAGSDVALLKVATNNLADMPLADSSKAEVGDFVIAIGNPFGLQHTVTSGIISGLGRTGVNPEGYEDFIQTDASINMGNSGGALVDLDGRLVGINTAIFSRSGGNIGIGFAIPSNMVKSVMTQLIDHGEVRRGMLGVDIGTRITPEVAQSLGLENTKGAFVSEVTAGSAAEKAGIKAGDVITSLNGRTIPGPAELRNMIGMLSIGEKVDIGLIRDGAPKRVTAIIGERTARAEPPGKIHPALEGATLNDADKSAGVVIQAVADGSPAARNRLRTNDVIIGIDRQRISNLEQLRTAVQNRTSFAVTILRGNARLAFVIG